MPFLSRHTLHQWIQVVIFGIAFAWVEAAVVVYLRKIYFDGVFQFPLVVNWVDGRHVLDDLMRIELGRELATLVMLAAVGCAAGRGGWQRFGFFMIAFGVWDIFYYVWLWVMQGWPESLMTWDLLFFIPLPWVGPVITPILIASALIAVGTIIVYFDDRGFSIHWRWHDWAVELGCAALLITAFCWDWKNILRIPDGTVRSGLPNPFAWWLYAPVLGFALAYFAWRCRQIVHDNRRS